MYQERKLLYLYCETPLHAGSGSDLGIVDLPIQRERHTGYPKIEASSLKGALREHLCRLGAGQHDEMVERTFGPDPDSDAANTFAGCVAFTDARLLCFPVRSVAGVFTWVTCPAVLARFCEDAGLAKVNLYPNHNEAFVDGDELTVAGNKIVLEEYAFTRKKDESKALVKVAGDIAKQVYPQGGALHDKLAGQLTLLNDEDFAFFTEQCTEVITRVRISQVTGTVEQGALFTEEYLPAESILYSQALASAEFVPKGTDARMPATKVMGYLDEQLGAHPRFQLGGNATLGKGHLFSALAKVQAFAETQNA